MKFKSLVNSLAFATALIVFFQTFTYGAEFTVTNINDSGDGSLRKAISDANGSAGYDVINVTVTGTVALLTALPTINDSVDINGSGQNSFVIDGQNGAGVRPINVTAAGIYVTIRNLTVTRGNGTSLGGGIRIDGGAIVTLSNLTVTANTGTGAAGINLAGSSTLYLTNSTLSNNTVTTPGGDGGGINVSSSVLVMKNTTVSGNVVPSSGASTGGGVNIATSSTPGSPPSFVRIENSTITGNSSQSGGGLYNTGGSTVRASNITVAGNSTSTTDASSSNGGGVFLNAGVGVITNSTIAGNTAGGTGAGGGIYTTGAGTTTIANTIVANNISGNAPSAEIRATTTAGGTFNTRGINVIEGTASGTLMVQNGSNITGIDPELSPLAGNGGDIQTIATAGTSNARNAGINTEALDTQDRPIGIDARGSGFARNTGGTVDIGAFEFSSAGQRARTAFDYDGDGRSDIGVFRPDDGTNYMLASGAGPAFTWNNFGLSTDKAAPADYDGDGLTDTAVFRDGVWWILYSASGQIAVRFFGLAGDFPRPGDFDGDGLADLAVFRPSDGIWYWLESSSGRFTGVAFGLAEDTPMLGDFDGDDKTDAAVFRSSEGNWYILQSSNGQVVVSSFGLPGDIPLNGDFNGDGRSDLAVFRPSDSYWYIARPTGVPAQNFDAFPWGLATDVPVPADYDGDGRTDAAVFRPGDSTWYIFNSGGGIGYTNFGIATDRPFQTAYRP